MFYGVPKPEISQPKIEIRDRRYTFLIANILIGHKINLLKIWRKIRFGVYFKYNTLIDIDLWNYNSIIVVVDIYLKS